LHNNNLVVVRSERRLDMHSQGAAVERGEVDCHCGRLDVIADYDPQSMDPGC